MNTLLLQSFIFSFCVDCGKILFNMKFCFACPSQCPLVHRLKTEGLPDVPISIAFHEFYDLIIGRSLVAFGDFAPRAPMNDNQTFLSRLVDTHRFHQPLAHGSAITGVNVDVFGEEAERAVASAGAMFQGRYGSMTLFTSE